MYLNQSENGFSDAKRLAVFPPMYSISNAATVDLFGKFYDYAEGNKIGQGTPCLVWSTALTGNARIMKYVDLTMGIKPHLLIRQVNNIGAESRFHYTPSTKFYPQDKLIGKPWITRLAFPVYCVEKIEIFEHITNSRFVSKYAYHHGFFDGFEREFRGFGMVERWDTEDFDPMNTDTSFPAVKNLGPSLRATPVYTKTWYHTGAYIHCHL